MYVIPIPPPPNPANSDNSYKWLVGFNDDLLKEVSGFFGDDEASVNKFLDNEQIKCNGNIYQEIQFRTIFIDEFLKAK